MLTKIHHALVDGMSGAEIMGLLSDLHRRAASCPSPSGGHAERGPGELEMLGRGLLGLPRYPLRALRSLPGALPNLEETPFAVLPGAGLLGSLGRGAQRTALRDGVLAAPHGSPLPRPPSTARSRPTGASRSARWRSTRSRR